MGAIGDRGAKRHRRQDAVLEVLRCARNDGSARTGKTSDEEVEGEEEQTQEEEESTPGEAAARELGNGMDDAGGNDTETRFAAAKIERADRNVAGEITTKGGKLVVDPEMKFSAMAPQGKCANHKDCVTDTS